MEKLLKPRRTKQAKVGDVVTSPLFMDGFRKSGVIQIFPQGFRSIAKLPNPKRLRSHDLLRKYDWFVVEKTKWMTRWQDTPNAWYCTARRLDKLHNYDPKGELIEFVQMAEDENYIEWVTRVAKMDHVFE